MSIDGKGIFLSAGPAETGTGRKKTVFYRDFQGYIVILSTIWTGMVGESHGKNGKKMKLTDGHGTDILDYSFRKEWRRVDEHHWSEDHLIASTAVLPGKSC